MAENTGALKNGSQVVPKHPGSENLIPWKPGQSGNPKGRPKAPSFRKLIQDMPELSKQQVVDRIHAIALKGRPGDATRAAEWLAKHSDDKGTVSVTTEDFTITIAPSAAMEDEEQDD